MGWVKLHRELLKHPRFQDGAWVQLWVALLLMATHDEVQMVCGAKVRMLKPGQFVTSRKSLAAVTGMSESKVERLMTKLETERQIEQENLGVNRLVTIVKWDVFQKPDRESNTDRTPCEHLPNTNKNEENVKKAEGEPATVVENSEIMRMVEFYRAFRECHPACSRFSDMDIAGMIRRYPHADPAEAINAFAAAWAGAQFPGHHPPLKEFARYLSRSESDNLQKKPARAAGARRLELT